MYGDFLLQNKNGLFQLKQLNIKGFDSKEKNIL